MSCESVNSQDHSFETFGSAGKTGNRPYKAIWALSEGKTSKVQ